MNDFPKETLLTAILHEDKMIIVEGMHRANALANWNLSEPPKGKVFLALARWDEKVPILGSGYKNK